MRHAPLLLLVVALCGCGEGRRDAKTDTPGERIEAAAVAQGLVAPTSHDLGGLWARDSDRLCLVPQPGGDYRAGAVVDYGDGQSCAASGRARQEGERLHVAFGACGFDAAIDDRTIRFPASLPRACRAMCRDRADLGAFTVERLESSVVEARGMAAPDGRRLCGG